MNQLETLLDTLIQRGWKPWGLEYFVYVLVSGSIVSFVTAKGATIYRGMPELVSLESGLWQFVCKNNLYKKEANNFRENVSKVGNNIGWFNHNYQYRLLESALVPEEELGKFLVENIKTETE